MWLIAGFSCRSKSPCNSSRAQHKACIAEKSSAETAVTWGHIADYVGRTNPPVLILENVVQLASGGEEESDLRCILDELRSRDYEAKDFIIEAKD